MENRSEAAPAWFREDLIALLDLLQQQEIQPLIAQRLPLAEARHAHELLGTGGVTGKIVLVRNRSSPSPPLALVTS
jgi:NADPH2:quinone reductase